jgi:hypothetical protein
MALAKFTLAPVQRQILERELSEVGPGRWRWEWTYSMTNSGVVREAFWTGMTQRQRSAVRDLVNRLVAHEAGHQGIAAEIQRIQFSSPRALVVNAASSREAGERIAADLAFTVQADTNLVNLIFHEIYESYVTHGETQTRLGGANTDADICNDYTFLGHSQLITAVANSKEDVTEYYHWDLALNQSEYSVTNGSEPIDCEESSSCDVTVGELAERDALSFHRESNGSWPCANGPNGEFIECRSHVRSELHTSVMHSDDGFSVDGTVSLEATVAPSRHGAEASAEVIIALAVARPSIVRVTSCDLFDKSDFEYHEDFVDAGAGCSFRAGGNAVGNPKLVPVESYLGGRSDGAAGEDLPPEVLAQLKQMMESLDPDDIEAAFQQMPPELAAQFKSVLNPSTDPVQTEERALPEVIPAATSLLNLKSIVVSKDFSDSHILVFHLSSELESPGAALERDFSISVSPTEMEAAPPRVAFAR